MKWLPVPKRAQMIGVIAAIHLRMLLENRVVTRLQRLPRLPRCARGSDSTRPIAATAMIGSAVRHCLLDRGANPLQVIRQIASVEVGFTAIMPQPMSTPTAAGMIAPFVGITLPTVAPSPSARPAWPPPI